MSKVLLIPAFKASKDNLHERKYTCLNKYLSMDSLQTSSCVKLIIFFGGLANSMDFVNTSMYFNYNFNNNFDYIKQSFL